jgi:NAD(P)-dependent dehydrogenase (short-subunit alcohol dehydrogenase family)
MGRIANKIALITGAAGGIGLATAELFAQEGAKVVMTDINIGKLEAQGRRMAAEGLTVTVAAHDVTLPEDWDRIISATLERHSRLDIVVNNAGIGHLANVEEETLEGWRRILGINLDAVFLGTQKAIKVMKAQGGSIVNISSIEGIIGESPLAAYNASKGGVRIFTKSAALHCAEQGYGIRVNSIHPGYVITPMVTDTIAALPADVAEALQKDLLGRIPLGRLAEAREIAQAILFVASDDASYMTGAELVIDGGYTAR